MTNFNSKSITGEKFLSDRTGTKSPLRRLKNIGMVSEKLYRNTLKILIQKSCSACCFPVRSRSMKIRCTIQINQLSLGQPPGTRTGKNIFDARPFNRDVKFLSLKVGSFLTFQKACLSITLFEINHQSVFFEPMT